VSRELADQKGEGQEERGPGAGPELSRGKRWLFTAILGAASLFAALVIGEIAARVAQSGGPSAEGDGGTLYEHDPLYGWKKRPATTLRVQTAEYDVTQTINALGLRGPETTREKPPGTRRVLLLGDSFLEGYTVDEGDLVSTQLETLLQLDGGAPVEVLNAGTAGYSTDQELLYFENEGRTFEPDVTVLLFYVNDVFFNVNGSYWRGEKPYFEPTDSGPALRGVPVPPPEENRYAFEVQGGTGLVALVRRADAWLGARSALHRLVRGAVTDSPALSGLAIRLGAADVPGEFRPWQRTPDAEIERAWSVTESLIARLRDSVVGAGSEFLVFYVPSRPAVYPDDWRRTRRAYAMDDEAWSPAADADFLSGVCQRLSLRCVLPVEEFREEASRIEGDGGRLYFAGDGHWTAGGHALAARLLADALGGVR